MASSRKVSPITPVSSASDDGTQFVSMYQKQATIYPRAVKGWFATWRWFFVWLTQLLFYGLPWLQWDGRQAVLFDLEAQRFYIFGLLLYPQDLSFLAALLVLSALALFFFTAVAGRSVPLLFEVTVVSPTAGTGTGRSAIQFEKSTFFVPR